jgi:Ser/Thr protein kinase RdoA (MazF antagonist)
MLSGPPLQVLEQLGLRSSAMTTLKDVPGGNGNWLAETAGERVVLRRYRAGTTAADLSYEHAVLRHLAAGGWVVPVPVGQAIRYEGLWYGLTRYVPGRASTDEGIAQQRSRGRALARLHIALRDLADGTGQRPGWQPQHSGVTTWTGLDTDTCLAGLTEGSPRLGTWAAAAARQSRDELAAIGASRLPLTVVHGDFAPWNVHYEQDRLAGVIDFALTHLDSRPYELAIARTYRAPQAVQAYRAELAIGGWPLSELEETAIEPVYRAFRVAMAAWEIERGRIAGDYDLAAIERQLARTGTPPP